MALIHHVFPHCFACREVLRSFVFASNAHETHLNLFLQILYETFSVRTELQLGNEEPVAGLHMPQIVLKGRRLILAEETDIGILNKGLGLLGSLGSFGLHLL